MPAATLQEEGLTVIFVGSFNPAIFHPEWFARMGVIPIDDIKEGAADVKFLSHDAADVTFSGMKLQCLPERLTISAVNPGRFAQLQELLIATLRILPHTPFHACGINRSLDYLLQSEEYWHKIGHALVPKDPVWRSVFTDPRTQSVSIKQRREGEFPGDVNVTVEPSVRHHPAVFIRSNWHYPLTVEQRHSESAGTMVAYLSSAWTDACSQATDVAKAVFEHIRPNE